MRERVRQTDRERETDRHSERMQATERQSTYKEVLHELLAGMCGESHGEEVALRQQDVVGVGEVQVVHERSLGVRRLRSRHRVLHRLTTTPGGRPVTLQRY